MLFAWWCLAILSVVDGDCIAIGGGGEMVVIGSVGLVVGFVVGI